MTELIFENFNFNIQDKEVKVIFGKNYYFTLPLEKFKEIDPAIQIHHKKLIFPNLSEKSANNKFNRILDYGFLNLTNKITGKKVLFIDSNIPLIGSSEFGIVDRNTNIIEIKPLTGCNLNCVYCSVNEGDNEKTIDVLIDPNYLLDEVSKLTSSKKHPIEFNINPQGEPLLYPFLEDLIEGLKELSSIVSINTNGTLLSEKKIDALVEAGLDRINLSLNTLDAETCNKLSGKAYPLKHVLKMIEYAQSKGLSVLIAPVIVPTFNDDNEKDIKPLIELASKLKGPYPKIGFQKFLQNKGGRNPVPEISFTEFFENLKKFEKEDLILTPKKDYNPFSIFEDKTLEKPFHKNETISVEIIGPGRNLGEILCKSSDRIVTVRGLKKEKGSAKVKLVRDKHNIFIGIPLGLV